MKQSILHFCQCPVGQRIEVLHFKFGKYQPGCILTPKSPALHKGSGTREIELTGIVINRLQILGTCIHVFGINHTDSPVHDVKAALYGIGISHTSENGIYLEFIFPYASRSLSGVTKGAVE